MALETVVYPQQDPFDSYNYKEFYSLASTAWGMHEEQEDQALLGNPDQNIEHQVASAKWDTSSCPSMSMMQHAKQLDPKSYSPDTCIVDKSSKGSLFLTVDQSSTGSMFPHIDTVAPPASRRRKRRLTRSSKNQEELENQRMTHIFVERNRRKQMNEYLAMLRSLMPPSYVQRGDQASIIGGAINFVKELEQLLQSMKIQKQIKQQSEQSRFVTSAFTEFFTFPQFSTRAIQNNNTNISSALENEDTNMANNQHSKAVADIEVTMMDNHANLKILANKRPKQLLKMVAGFQSIGLNIQHLNLTSFDQMVMYSVSIKVEEENRQLNTVDEIAAAVNQVLSRIQEESAFS